MVIRGGMAEETETVRKEQILQLLNGTDTRHLDLTLRSLVEMMTRAHS